MQHFGSRRPAIACVIEEAELRSRPIIAAFGLLITGLIVPVQASPSATAATVCPSMQVIGIRGSGETADDYGGFGRTVKSEVDAIRAANPTAAATPVDYPAIPVQPFNPKYYAGAYTNSVRAGVSATQTVIKTFMAGACGTTTYMYLVGYSQGAQVAGDVYQAMSTAQRARVGGVTLIADPKFRGSQGGGVNVGTFNKTLNGIQYVLGPYRTIAKAQQPFVRSYCAAGDAVCNFTKTSAALCLVSCVHTAYPEAVLPSGLGYVQSAAVFLVNQWRKLGPKPPVIGSKSNVLIFGTYSPTEGELNIEAALTAAGYTVTHQDALPVDLSAYGQVWWYDYAPNPLSQDEVNRLISFSRSGGSLLLSGEWQSCSCNDASVKAIFDSLVVTVGGLQFGPDLGTGVDHGLVNSTALDGSTKAPNVLTGYQSNAIGTISSANIGNDHFLFTDDGSATGNGTMGVWDNTDVVGGGRLAIVMDVNWVEPSYGANSAEFNPILSNLAYFLSGATTPPGAVLPTGAVPRAAHGRTPSRTVNPTVAR